MTKIIHGADHISTIGATVTNAVADASKAIGADEGDAFLGIAAALCFLAEQHTGSAALARKMVNNALDMWLPKGSERAETRQ